MDIELHTVDRLKQRFGTINRVAEACGRKQNTVSGWRTRPGGVPLEDAFKIAEAAPAMGVEITYEEIAAWIAADVRRRSATA